MTVMSWQYLAEGVEWASGDFDTNHTDPQAFADALNALPLREPTDEIRVWGGPIVGDPDAVVFRPLSCEGVPL